MRSQRLSDERMRALDASLVDAGASGKSVDGLFADPPRGGRYVYCVICQEGSRDFGEIGIGGGSRVYTVHHAGLAAVVSDTPIMTYDPTRENMLAHQFVNETVMEEFTVIPMSFGTVFRSEGDVGQLLLAAYKPFTDVLEKMKDKFEFGVQVRWDRDRVIEGELLDSTSLYISTVHEELKRVSVASRCNKVIGDRMILNAAFLVDRAGETTFDDAVKQLSLRFESLLAFKYTGPWPPYNFVNIKLKLERAD